MSPKLRPVVFDNIKNVRRKRKSIGDSETSSKKLKDDNKMPSRHKITDEKALELLLESDGDDTDNFTESSESESDSCDENIKELLQNASSSSSSSTVTKSVNDSQGSSSVQNSQDVTDLPEHLSEPEGSESEDASDDEGEELSSDEDEEWDITQRPSRRCNYDEFTVYDMPEQFETLTDNEVYTTAAPIAQWANNVILPEDEANEWFAYDEDPGPTIADFDNDRPGMALDPTGFKPYDYFSLMIEDRFFTILAENTNDYAFGRISKGKIQ